MHRLACGDVPDQRVSLSENRWAGVIFRAFAGVYRGCGPIGTKRGVYDAGQAKWL